jgi:hypothetical protein
MQNHPCEKSIHVERQTMPVCCCLLQNKQFEHKTKCNIKMSAEKCHEITTMVMGYGQEDQGIGA